MEELKIKTAKIESKLRFYGYGELQGCAYALEWTLTIKATDNKIYIYVGDEETFPTYNSVKDYFLDEVHSDLGEKAYFQLLSKINLL